VEPLQPTPAQSALADLGDELDRIAGGVAAGNHDLRALGFWRAVARIKRDQVAIARYADEVGRIDTHVFRSAVRTRVRPWIGVTALLLVTAGGVAAVVAASVWTGFWAGAALVAAGVAWSIGWHLPAHAFAGWLAGIRFTDVFLGGPPPPRPGLKTDYGSYLRAEPALRVWFHASGAIATKLAPFVALALWPATNAPGWAAWVLLGLGSLQIATDFMFSSKSSDWKKVARERGVTRDIRERWNRS
jgi:hypothetical protein